MSIFVIAFCLCFLSGALLGISAYFTLQQVDKENGKELTPKQKRRNIIFFTLATLSFILFLTFVMVYIGPDIG